MPEPVVVAILAKDKEYCLPLFLQSIYNQTYPKNLIHLYIRTNDNKDNTAEVLREWLEAHQNEYASCTAIFDSVDETLKEYAEHQWNPHRFSVLGKIRESSIEFAKSIDAHYFTADCDNFLTPNTLQRLAEVGHLGVVSPLLDSSIRSSNLHHCADPNGYYKECGEYNAVRYKRVRGLIEVEVAHMTYWINKEFLSKIVYNDSSNRYEYVIFSHWLRFFGIKQFMDSREDYGFLLCDDDLKNWKEVIFKHFFISYKELFNPATPQFAKYLLTLFDF